MRAALLRARGALVAAAVTQVAFLVLGATTATLGWSFAVSQRDAIVGGAGGSPITRALDRGDRLPAALLDFGGNLFLAAVPTSVAGLTVVGPFPIAAYRGWVGGVVVIDSQHRSRLRTLRGAAYYLVTIALQVAGFVLTMGAGVYLGLTAWRRRRDESVRSLAGFRLPRQALVDAAWLYAAAIPCFLAGSLWEFLLA